MECHRLTLHDDVASFILSHKELAADTLCLAIEAPFISTLSLFEFRIFFVDNIDNPFATHYFAFRGTFFYRNSNFHCFNILSVTSF